MPVSDAIQKAINDQIQKEFASAYLYLAMRRVYARSAVGTALRTLFTSVASGALLGGWLWSTTLLAERLA